MNNQYYVYSINISKKVRVGTKLPSLLFVSRLWPLLRGDIYPASNGKQWVYSSSIGDVGPTSSRPWMRCVYTVPAAGNTDSLFPTT
jgi:hypothetical protein